MNCSPEFLKIMGRSRSNAATGLQLSFGVVWVQISGIDKKLSPAFAGRKFLHPGGFHLQVPAAAVLDVLEAW